MTDAPETPCTVASLLDAMVKAATMLADEPARLSRLQTFTDMWGLDCYTPPESVEVDAVMIVQAMIALAVRVERERGEPAAVPQPPPEPTDAEVEAAAWTKTTDRLPEKPGVGSYEHVECLIVIRGEVKFALWNCEHLCWDDNDGDDFLYHPTEPTHWMPRPAPPRAALIAARKARA